jgi:hypothetical protein
MQPGGDGVGVCAAFTIDVHHRRAERAQRAAGRDPLHDPPGEQGCDVVGPLNTTMATICNASAPRSTGLRPRWSDALPSTSSAASRSTAYVPNTVVVVIGEKCQTSAYVA